MTIDTAAIRARRDAAHQMVNDLCQGRRDWMMSIPARRDYDPDLVIDASLGDIPALCDAVERLTAEREALRTIVGRYGRHDRMCLPHQDGTCDCGFDQARAKVEATDE